MVVVVVVRGVVWVVWVRVVLFGLGESVPSESRLRFGGCLNALGVSGSMFSESFSGWWFLGRAARPVLLG